LGHFLRQLRNLLWHIAFAEEDGIVAGLLAFVGQAHRLKDVLVWVQSGDKKSASQLTPQLASSAGAPSMSSTSAMVSGKQKVIGEFLAMMHESLAVQAGYKPTKLRLR
jgi:hypothetical protein